MSLSNIVNAQNNSLNFDFAATFASIPPPTPEFQLDAIVVETLDEPEKDESISYAELTKVRIDQATLQAARPFFEKRFNPKLKSISVRDARLINSKAKTEIISLNAERIEWVPVDQFIRQRLEQIETKIRTKACEQLEFPEGFFWQIISGRTQIILKERAVKCNEYFNITLEDNSEQFDLERIFRLALKESLPTEPAKKLCERIWIKYENKYRDQLKKLRKTVNDPRFNEVKKIRTDRKHIKLKDVVILHKFSADAVFDLTKESVALFPVLPEHIEKLQSLTSKAPNEKMRSKIYRLIDGTIKNIEYSTAETLNSSLGETVFDVEVILNQGIQEAEKEFLALSKKRTSPSEAPSEPSAKRQRIGEHAYSAHVPTSTKDKAAPFIEKVNEPL